MKNNTNIYIGLDVGSTTAKAVVVDEHNQIVWKKYQRHNARQQELVLEYLNDIEQTFLGSNITIFTTGSGGRTVADVVGGIHVQEVNAVTVATEKLHPNVGSVVELGGQDSKIILWKRDRHGRKSSISYMNDKCAGGTGATLDKIFSKVHLHPDEISSIRATGKTIHHIAAKCGVFAETDVVGLLKAGVAEDEIVVSLCSAVVKQNIEVLLHGNSLADDVLLLGGPHTYFKAFADIWRQEVPEIWKLHHWEPKKRPIEDIIYVPDDAQYFAAMGAVWFGRESYSMLAGTRRIPQYQGAKAIEQSIETSKTTVSKSLGTVRSGLVASDEEAAAFCAEYAPGPFCPPTYQKGQKVLGYLGIDGGSTSSKLAIVNEQEELIYKDYVLSKGNPIVDMVAMFRRILQWEKEQGIVLEIVKAGVTGYASSILQTAFRLDSQVVETIAHLKSSKQFYGDVDIICDVGGQDIKVMFMKHGRVIDIKLNTQCSAGNGYFLQSMANQFNVPIEEYAERAFSVRKAPSFNYGCAVFMEQDKVNFQQLGWSKDEIMAGLALVLPQNIWNYVVQETNLARIGKRFLLQGGTQKNMAAVKAQVDFIQSRVEDAWVGVHKYADVAGAIGAAFEARTQTEGKDSTFIGLKDAVNVSFTSKNDESTRCRFCSNKCTRTFIDIVAPNQVPVRHISGFACDKGASQNIEEMKAVLLQNQETLRHSPNLVEYAETKVFAAYDATPKLELTSEKALAKRAKMVVGMPRLLNMFYYAPFFYAYFKALGIGKVIYSDATSKQMWSKGNKWGSIDPCFPAKVAPAHVYNLMLKSEITHICFPMITHLESMVTNTLGNNACVIQMGTPEVVEAAFTKGRNHFKDAQVEFWKPLVRMDRRAEALGNLYEYFATEFGVTEAESNYAAECGYGAMEQYLTDLRTQGTAVINQLVDEDQIGILFIGHPYHHDIGLNHGILQEFSKAGFPVLCIESLPVTSDFLVPLFGNSPMETSDSSEITDVWQRNFNRNTNLKIWAAKVAARHPNLAVVDMSSFKCGHDAPTYSYVDRILDASETPHFLFHDMDQNKPSSTIKIRIQSIEYFLKEEHQRLKERVKNASKSA